MPSEIIHAIAIKPFARRTIGLAGIKGYLALKVDHPAHSLRQLGNGNVRAKTNVNVAKLRVDFGCKCLQF
jgi:hypothetical protein